MINVMSHNLSSSLKEVFACDWLFTIIIAQWVKTKPLLPGICRLHTIYTHIPISITERSLSLTVNRLEHPGPVLFRLA